MSGANEPNESATEQEQTGGAAFMAGFDEDDFADHSAPTEPVPAETQQNASATPPAAPAPESQPVAEDPFAGLPTAVREKLGRFDQLEADFTRTMGDWNRAQGRIGALQSAIAKLQQATPEGQALQISEEDFADLKKEYPEIAATTIRGLNKALGKFKGMGADSEAVARMVTERVQEAIPAVRKEIVNSALDAVLPDWETEVKTPKFDAWFKSQTADVQALAQSSKVGDAARLLRAYEKSASAPPAPPPPPAAPAAPAQPSMRSRQVAAAVPPRGDSASPPSRKGSPFQEGFDEDD